MECPGSVRGRDDSCREGILPFRIDVPQSDLDDLHARLDRVRWPDELPGMGWAYGIPRGCLRELTDYWRHEYDWRAEARLNQWPQFTTTIDRASMRAEAVAPAACLAIRPGR
jgi:epoxide hydrolase